MARRRQPVRGEEGEVEWNFFSFPVVFGFCLGAFIASILVLALPYGLIWGVSLFGVSFGTAHIITHWWRRRSVARARQRREEEERERRALAARAAAARQQAEAASRRRRRRRGQRDGGDAQTPPGAE